MPLIRQENPWLVGAGIGQGLSGLAQVMAQMPEQRARAAMMQQQMQALPLERDLLKARTEESQAQRQRELAQAAQMVQEMDKIRQLGEAVKTWSSTQQQVEQGVAPADATVPLSEMLAALSQVPHAMRNGLVGDIGQMRGQSRMDLTQPDVAAVLGSGGKFQQETLSPQQTLVMPMTGQQVAFNPSQGATGSTMPFEQRQLLNQELIQARDALAMKQIVASSQQKFSADAQLATDGTPAAVDTYVQQRMSKLLEALGTTAPGAQTTSTRKAQGGYEVGSVYAGLKYLGGDPKDEKNWEKVR